MKLERLVCCVSYFCAIMCCVLTGRVALAAFSLESTDYGPPLWLATAVVGAAWVLSGPVHKSR